MLFRKRRTPAGIEIAIIIATVTLIAATLTESSVMKIPKTKKYLDFTCVYVACRTMHVNVSYSISLASRLRNHLLHSVMTTWVVSVESAPSNVLIKHNMIAFRICTCETWAEDILKSSLQINWISRVLVSLRISIYLKITLRVAPQTEVNQHSIQNSFKALVS